MIHSICCSPSNRIFRLVVNQATKLAAKATLVLEFINAIIAVPYVWEMSSVFWQWEWESKEADVTIHGKCHTCPQESLWTVVMLIKAGQTTTFTCHLCLLHKQNMVRCHPFFALLVLVEPLLLAIKAMLITGRQDCQKARAPKARHVYFALSTWSWPQASSSKEIQIGAFMLSVDLCAPFCCIWMCLTQCMDQQKMAIFKSIESFYRLFAALWNFYSGQKP